MPYEITVGGLVPIKSWTIGVPFEASAKIQLSKAALLPIIHSHIAVMPDVHLGIGATVGSVIPTVKAIIPAAVGVDIGCGMCAVRTTLSAKDLPDRADQLLFDHISKAVPHGGSKDKSVGKWDRLPKYVEHMWGTDLALGYKDIVGRHRRVEGAECARQLGTLGGGNHFIEVCLDEDDRVWFMLHSGSRGVGNRIGEYFIELARRDMSRLDRRLPDRDLAYFDEGTEHFDEYVKAVEWAQEYARLNRFLMMRTVEEAAQKAGLPRFTAAEEVVNCHHNYVTREHHFGADVWITRKGAVRAGVGDMGIIPGSMGAKSFIVRGKGDPESFHSCSHGAGRVMPRGKAKREITLKRHAEATAGVACRKDRDVIDESPDAYKSIDAVMAAQSDLVEIVHTLRQITCVKG